MKRDSMVLFRSMTEALRRLEPLDFMLMVLSITDYAMDDIEPEFSNPTLEALWFSFKPQIDANKRKFEAQLENGKKGGRPRKPKETQENPTKPKETQVKPYMRNEKGEMRNVLIPSSSSYAHEDENHLFERTVKIGMVPRKMG